MSVLDIRFLHPLSLPEIVGVCFLLAAAGSPDRELSEMSPDAFRRLAEQLHANLRGRT